MVNYGGMDFATSIGVLFALKESKGHKTLQETYQLLATSDMDIMLDILRISYNKQNATRLDFEAFEKLIEEKNVGFVVLMDAFQQVMEALMFSGMSPEAIEEKKKFMSQRK